MTASERDILYRLPPPTGYSPMYELDFESSVLEIDRQIDGLEENMIEIGSRARLRNFGRLATNCFARSTAICLPGRPSGCRGIRSDPTPTTTFG